MLQPLCYASPVRREFLADHLVYSACVFVDLTPFMPFAIISLTITTAITANRHGDKLWVGCSLACLVASRSHFATTRWPS